MSTAAATRNATTRTSTHNRLTPTDGDYQRLHTRTLAQLSTSLGQLVRDLRAVQAHGSNTNAESEAQSTFIARHTAILRSAYLAAYRAGVLDYYGVVSHTPQKWARSVPPNLHRLTQRMTFYAAPSIAKMAHEALTAVNAPKRLADSPPPASPLDAWQVQALGRAELQADVVWPGLQDGYLDGGASDTANPYAVVNWELDEAVARHCDDCPVYAAGSPYDAPGFSGNQLDATPGDGHTECGAACKCSLVYGTAPASDFRSIWANQQGSPPAPPDDGGVWPGGINPSAQLGADGQPTVAQQSAMDAYRDAHLRWEAIRGHLPALPDMFAPASHGANWPAWEAMTPAQRLALKSVYDALASFEHATPGGALPLDIAVAQNQAAQEDLAHLQGELEGLADHYDQFVDALNQATNQDVQELFSKGPLASLWFHLQQDLDAVIEFFWHLPPKDTQLTESDHGLTFNAETWPSQPRADHGHWGSTGNTGGEHASGGSTHASGLINTGMRHRGHPRNTPEQAAAAKERQRQSHAATRERARTARLDKMTPEERAARDTREQARAAGKARTPEETRAHNLEVQRARMNRQREAERQATRSKEELAVPRPQLKVGTANNAEINRYVAALKVARAAAKTRLTGERNHAASQVRLWHAKRATLLTATPRDAQALAHAHKQYVGWSAKLRDLRLQLAALSPESESALSEPRHYRGFLFSGHQPGYQQNRQAGGRFGVGDGGQHIDDQRSGSGGGGGGGNEGLPHGGGGRSGGSGSGARVRTAEINVQRTKAAMDKANEARVGRLHPEHEARDNVYYKAQLEHVKAQTELTLAHEAAAKEQQSAQRNEGKTPARVEQVAARRAELDTKFGAYSQARADEQMRQLYAQHPELRSELTTHYAGAQGSLTPEHAAKLAVRNLTGYVSHAREQEAIAHAHEGFSRMREISEWSLLHSSQVTPEGTVRLYRGERGHSTDEQSRQRLESNAPRRGTSWSSDRRVAEGFDGGRVIEAHVPVEHILTWHGIQHGMGFGNEQEYVVGTGRITDYTISPGTGK